MFSAILRASYFRNVISLILLLTLSIGVAAQMIRDYNVWLAWLGYIPLLLVALCALIWDLAWFGRSQTFIKRPFMLTFIAVLTLFWVFITLKGFGESQQRDNNPHISLLHWNIRWGGEHPKDNLPIFAKQIAEHNPDIIVISEKPAYPVYVKMFLDALGSEYKEPAITEPVMLLSKWHIYKEQELSFRHGMGLVVTVATPQGMLRVLVVDGDRDLRKARQALLGDVDRFCQKEKQAGHAVDVIVGDFNAVGRSRGFDSWEVDYRLAARVAGVWRGSWIAFLPLYDIDHVWLKNSIHNIQVQFFANAISDHRGQFVRFSL